MRELFVYYRVRGGEESVALNIVNAFQTELRRSLPQLSARLLRRSEAPDANETWMEVYAVDPAAGDEGVSPERQHIIETAARLLAPHIEGTRHAEVFVDAAHAQSRT